MSKLDEIKKYLNANEGKEKQVLINNICKKFSVTAKSADIYYYQWKKEFTGSNACVPKEEKNINKVQKQMDVKEKITIPHDIKPIIADEEEGVKVGEELFKNEDDLEAYRKVQVRNFYLMLSEITEVLKMVKVGN